MSKKAPLGALSTPNWNLPHHPLYPDFNAESLISDAYLRNLYVYRAVNYIANNIAGLPFRVGTGEKNGPFRTTHPLAQLLGPAPGSPNPMWAPNLMWRYSIAQYLVMGKVAWAVERSGNRTVGLWPLAAQHVRPILVDPTSRKPHYFEGYQYGVPGSSTYRTYKPDELIYLWRPSLTDPRQPESVVSVAAPEINLAWLISQFDTAFLQNGGVPSHMVVTDTFASDDERNGFRSQFTRQFGGAANAGRPLFAERDIETGEAGGAVDPVQVIKVGQSQIDSQLGTLRDSKISDVTVALGVPLSLLGESRVQTYSNIQEDRRNAWTETIRPTFREIEDLVNTHLSPMFDSKTVAWFDTDHVNELRPIPRYADADATKLVQSGLITENEYRADRGLPPLPASAIPKIAPVSDPAATTVAAEPDQLAPQDAPVPIKTAKPLKKDTVGAQSHLAVARALADNLVTEMVVAVEKRAAGRRVRAPFDEQYWHRRATATLGPSLRAAGLDELSAQFPINSLVSAVAIWAEQGELRDKTARDFASTIIDASLVTVSAEAVEDALIGMATGTVERDSALRLIQGGAS